MLSRATIDRNDVLRDDTDLLTQLWPSARLLPVDTQDRAPMRRHGNGLRLDFQSTAEFGSTPVASAVFLGEQNGLCYWAVRSGTSGQARQSFDWTVNLPSSDEPAWLDLRSAGALLSDMDAGIATTALAALNWHAQAEYCAKCGAKTKSRRAGWVRTCTGCGREEYPRTDPAVICVVHDGVDQTLLARQPNWPEHRYSVLAGFVEAGESLEACVVREVAEEVGVTVHSLHYLGSQPWPFPRSLMIGFAGIADPATALRPAPGEIEKAMWVSRDDVRAALASDDAVPGLILPGETSISRRMLEAWVLG